LIRPARSLNLFLIFGIIIVILLVLRFPSFPQWIFFVGLLASLLLCYGIPLRGLLEYSSMFLGIKAL
jgi:hypothetical protein